MSLAITPLYGGLIGLLLVVLSVRVILRRRAARVSVGDGEDKDLRKRIRVQANCAEYAPIGLLLLAMAELQGAPGWVVHLLGLMLLAGRIFHVYGFGSTPQIIPMRQLGMGLTFGMLILASLASIGHALT
ncbi:MULTISPECIES: MAPEG family protein [unclassified Roseovarius]|uniref:MAPEG family protein n=1 Tax=unclassified Roseovarius TaxID=2614913 RepID=UPI00273F6052|nr:MULTISPECIES: MAPEG family protein [unclassified Roseovarius]